MKPERLFVFMLSLLLVGCVNDEQEELRPEVEVERRELSSFSFLKAHNKHLDKDAVAAITGNTITVQVPPEVPTDSLVASFTKTGNSTAYINSQKQTSGISAGNYSEPVVLKLVSEDSKVTNYRVEVNSMLPELDYNLQLIMQRYHIPGVSIGIAKNEKLVFVKSYGIADKTTGELVSNESRFRIASVAKPITAIAILKLVQEGKLALSDKVFAPGGILFDEYGAPPQGSGKELITIQHLIDHKSGWANLPDDPLFGNFTLTHQQIISEAIQARPLSYTPGTTFFYSNLGYCILGRIIEKASGTSYENYIKQAVLQPAGIHNMELAGNQYEQRAANEVAYYQSELDPYAFNVTRMDANGGWIATATDVLRFMVHIDRNGSKPDIVDSSLMATTYFNLHNWHHSGSLPGTSAMLTRLNDEYSIVVLANSRLESQPLLVAEDLTNAISVILQSFTSWADVDLFETNPAIINLAQQ